MVLLLFFKQSHSPLFSSFWPVFWDGQGNGSCCVLSLTGHPTRQEETKMSRNHHQAIMNDCPVADSCLVFVKVSANFG